MKNKKILGVDISNPDRVIEDTIRKIDILKYYEYALDLMLPYVFMRPISEIRCHTNLNNTFFKKHPNNSNKLITIENKEDIIKECQNGTLEFHTYSYIAPNAFNYMVFDLDPDEKLGLNKVRQGVRDLKSILDELNLKSFLKTSGGKGYHVVVPFLSVSSLKAFELFAQKIAKLMETKWPKRYTTNIKKDSRKGKIFVDYLRNKKGATCVAPYSLRARKNLPISFPIGFKELDKFFPDKVNIKNFKKYFVLNAWEGFFEINQKLQ